MADPVIPLEFSRMMFGDQSALFFVEIVIRTLIIYSYTFVLIRFIGRSSKSKLSILDILVILALGSAVGDGAFYPEVPILHCILVVTVVILINKSIVSLTYEIPRLRELVEGKPRRIIIDGVILTDELAKTGVGRSALLELLRLKGISNLGQLELVILEPSCDVSVYRRTEAVEGLSILPWTDRESDADCADGNGVECCGNCGEVRQANETACDKDSCGNADIRLHTPPEFK